VTQSDSFEFSLLGFERRLAAIEQAGGSRRLAGGMIGLEKESLRVAADGTLSQRRHPAALGSPLVHPWITTDFSEALLEFITPPFTDGEHAVEFMADLQAYVYAHLDDEILWATSMPCVVAGETNIPIASYGGSHAGFMKHVYRVGLGHRYGKVMQVIAGVHFNYSVQEGLWPLLQDIAGDAGERRDFADTGYMGMMRNLQRWGWLVPYLFGASPAVCKSFFGGKATSMPEFDEGTYYEPFATSLRMGDIGYQNEKEESVGIKACYDSLESYIRSLTKAIETPASQWQAIGVKVDGEWRQLNANILQIENEYYSSIRPKQLLEGLEKPTLALKKRGIRYVELRSPDVNAFHPLGLDSGQLRFLEALMLFCLLADSPLIEHDEAREIDFNLQRTAHQGRKPGLQLVREQREVPLRRWAEDVLKAMQPLCSLLDGVRGGTAYAEALGEQRVKVDDPSMTPSALMLAEMRANGESFHAYAWRMSRQHRAYFSGRRLTAGSVARLDETAQVSDDEQEQLEKSSNGSFDDFLAAYFDQH
jgi:glutamate--cysteine ligase